MDAEPVEIIVERLSAFPWGRAERIDDEADALARQHVVAMTEVIERLGADLGIDVHEAYAYAQSAGHDTPRHEALNHALFKMKALKGLSCREHIILSVASFHCWTFDRDLGKLGNPWGPVMALYEKGYQTSFDELEQPLALELVFIARSDQRSYRIG